MIVRTIRRSIPPLAWDTQRCQTDEQWCPVRPSFDYPGIDNGLSGLLHERRLLEYSDTTTVQFALERNDNSSVERGSLSELES
jgi:hypothetical protein